MHIETRTKQANDKCKNKQRLAHFGAKLSSVFVHEQLFRTVVVVLVVQMDACVRKRTM